MWYLLLTVLAVGSRLLPHPSNVAPIGGLALFSGAKAGEKTHGFTPLVALSLPFVALIISDVLIGFYTWQVMISVYLGFALTAGIGWLIRKRQNWPVIMSASLLGSISFFMLTNTAVWAFTPMYAKTVTGLIESYTMALPFFRNSLIGDLLYTSLLFGVYQAASNQQLAAAKKEASWLKLSN